MNKEKKQLAVIAAGVIILLVVVISNIKAKKTRKPGIVDLAASRVKVVNSADALAKPADINVKDLQAQTERARAPWGRDPFAAELDRAANISELKLQGISYGNDGAGFAFINDEIVKKGGKIGDYEVAEVLKDRVLVKKGNQSFYLTFMEE